MYLNLAPYGNQIAGAERASRAYFGVPASHATPAQAAFLAGLPQRPSGFNPYRSRDGALSRGSAWCCGAWRPSGAAHGRADARRRVTDALDVHPAAVAICWRRTSSRWCSRRRRRASRDASRRRSTRRCRPTSPASSRASAPRCAGTALQNVAVVVLDNARGEWLAWEGSGDYFDAAHGGTINGPVTPRQPGSALKPFTYALAFEEGFSPASVLADVPSSFPTAEPASSTARATTTAGIRGPLLARLALAGSENVPAVALASELGVPKLLRFLTRAGFTTFDKTASYYGLGVTLGNAEVRLDELVAAYAAFARGGEWIAPTFLPRAPGAVPLTRRLVSPRSAFWITDILSDPEAREFMFGRGGSLEFPFPVAVKTGTSQAYPRQLDGRLLAARHGRRLGRQLRSHAAAQLERRHRRRRRSSMP